MNISSLLSVKYTSYNSERFGSLIFVWNEASFRNCASFQRMFLALKKQRARFLKVQFVIFISGQMEEGEGNYTGA